jgi:hypothetical protein
MMVGSRIVLSLRFISDPTYHSGPKNGQLVVAQDLGS